MAAATLARLRGGGFRGQLGRGATGVCNGDCGDETYLGLVVL